MIDTAAPTAVEASAPVAPCPPDCSVHESHRQVVLGADGRLYPAPLRDERPRGFLGRLGRRIADGPRWLAPAAIVLGSLLPVWYVLANDPTDAEPDLGACAFKLLTGFDCPGCGGTRALWYVLHGDIADAARYHAVAVFAAPFLAYMFLAWAWRRIFPNAKFTPPKLTLGATTISVFLAVWGVFWVVRNLPWAPFTALYV